MQKENTYDRKIAKTTKCPACGCEFLHKDGKIKFCDRCDFDINYAFFEKVEHIGRAKAIKMLKLKNAMTRAEGAEWEQVKRDFQAEKAWVAKRQAQLKKELEQLASMEIELNHMENIHPRELQ